MAGVEMAGWMGVWRGEDGAWWEESLLGVLWGQGEKSILGRLSGWDLWDAPWDTVATAWPAARPWGTGSWMWTVCWAFADGD